MSDFRESVKAAVMEQAFLETDTGRQIVHSFLGGIGADWDAEDVCELVDRATTTVGWVDGIAGHDLLVSEPREDRPGQRVYYFQVTNPQDLERLLEENKKLRDILDLFLESHDSMLDSLRAGAEEVLRDE